MLAARLVCLRTLPSKVFHPAITKASPVVKNSITKNQWLLTPRFVAGGAAVGLGTLCYYGLGMSNEIGAIEKAVIWPQYVKDRIHSTYMYLAGSIGVTALSALAIAKSPVLMNFMLRGSWV
ncbi:PREDICTED: growth hormone-inducible transmembrane protein-like, partial [Dipodomys ordii]|uniref:Growth hormone-inducible transmembrane protein-like n=1 Tax=Dipodomys ordii TaxID=10020 RepID=A0A1S3GUZ1_DIPOR